MAPDKRGVSNSKRERIIDDLKTWYFLRSLKVNFSVFLCPFEITHYTEEIILSNYNFNVFFLWCHNCSFDYVVAKLSGCQIVQRQIVNFLILVPNCPGTKLSGWKIVWVPNCLGEKLSGAKLSYHLMCSSIWTQAFFPQYAHDFKPMTNNKGKKRFS